jgi:predicted nucleic acid-binding protein
VNSARRTQREIKLSRRRGLAENLLLRSSRSLLLDTNILIYFLSGEQPYHDALVPVFRRVQAGSLTVVVSVITEAELLVRPEKEDNEAARERIADLLSEEGFWVVATDRRIARKAAALRGRQNFKLADAIILATAIETGCEAIVSNDGEWSKKPAEIPVIRMADLVTS